MPHFIHAGITCTGIFSSSAHKRPAHFSVIGDVLLLESIIWCTQIVHCPEFGGCPLFGSSKYIEYTKIAVATLTCCPYTVDVRYWKSPLTEVPLYNYILSIAPCLPHVARLR